MTDPIITCPNCSTKIKLTESLAAPLVEATRKEYEKKILEKESSLSKRETALRIQEQNVTDTQKGIDEKISKKLKEERIIIVAEEAKKAKIVIASDLDAKNKELNELQDILQKKNDKLVEAQKAQTNFLKKQRELDEQKRELDLTVEKRVQVSISEVREKAKREIEGGLKLKVSEKEEQIASMQRQIEDLRRKAEQGSQQLQGEVMELKLEETLRSQFPFDNIEAVAKGEYGGDIFQHVISQNGLSCGTILWESKRTKNWSDSWLIKLRNDQREAKAEMSILVSQTLPKDIKSFGQIDNVWISAYKHAIPLSIALRQTLIEVANSKKFQEGQQTKMALVYEYLTGSRFRHRVEAIVEQFSEMKIDLDREKKVMTRLWAKREIQIQGVIGSTVGMYGDLQGIAGRALQEIDGLEMSLLENKKK